MTPSNVINKIGLKRIDRIVFIIKIYFRLLADGSDGGSVICGQPIVDRRSLKKKKIENFLKLIIIYTMYYHNRRRFV